MIERELCVTTLDFLQQAGKARETKAHPCLALFPVRPMSELKKLKVIRRFKFLICN